MPIIDNSSQNAHPLKKIFVLSQPEVVDTVGGAITVFLNFCNLLSEHGYDVTGICYSKTNKCPNRLNDSVKFINLCYYKKNNRSFSEAFNDLTETENPDLIIFFFNNLYIEANLLEKFNSIPRILMIHSRPDVYFNSDTELTLKKIYTNTTTQILFDSYINLLPDFIQKGPVITIPNSVKAQKKFIDINNEKKKIIYLSRIDNCKGLEFLINSFKLIAEKHKNWSIEIYGQSQPPKYVKSLIKLTKKLKIDKQIKFKGITNNPIETFLDYDFCVFPSFFEGFPMGLIEAQSVGLPCIGLECCSGVNELIIDDYNGLLAQYTPQDFAKKIDLLICNKELRKKFSKNTLKEVQKYNSEIINKKWLETIENILSGKKLETLHASSENSKILFPISTIKDLLNNNKKLKFYQYLFSVRNQYTKGYKIKIIYILGIKISIKKESI